MSLRHKSPQRFFVADGNKLYGTPTLKGFTESAAHKKAMLCNQVFKTKRFKVREVISYDQLEQEIA